MSIAAIHWLVGQRGLDAYEFRVMHALCDHFNPEHGCFPDQERLAARCEMSRSGLNKVLDRLELKGAIRREARVDAATHRQMSTRYRLACERGFKPADGAAGAVPAGAEAEESASDMPDDAAGPEPREQGSRVHAVDTALEKAESTPEQSRVHVRGLGYKAEPVTEPVIEREGAREASREGGEHAAASPPAGMPDLETFRAAWPTTITDSAPRIEAAWNRLGLGDRRAALAGVAPYLAALKAGGRKFTPAGSTYLSERAWERLPAMAAEQAAGDRVSAKALSRDWWALVWGRIAAGKPAGFVLSLADGGGSAAATRAELAAGRVGDLKAFPHDGAAWPLWRDWLRARGLRPPDVRGPAGGGKAWLFLPGPTPPASGNDPFAGMAGAAGGTDEERKRA